LKSLVKRDGPKAPTDIHCPLDLKYQTREAATTTADRLGEQLAQHVLCDENHKRRVETKTQILFEAADGTPSKM
jgi:hypothetical protein